MGVCIKTITVHNEYGLTVENNVVSEMVFTVIWITRGFFIIIHIFIWDLSD